MVRTATRGRRSRSAGPPGRPAEGRARCRCRPRCRSRRGRPAQCRRRCRCRPRCRSRRGRPARFRSRPGPRRHQGGRSRRSRHPGCRSRSRSRSRCRSHVRSRWRSRRRRRSALPRSGHPGPVRRWPRPASPAYPARQVIPASPSPRCPSCPGADRACPRRRRRDAGRPLVCVALLVTGSRGRPTRGAFRRSRSRAPGEPVVLTGRGRSVVGGKAHAVQRVVEDVLDVGGEGADGSAHPDRGRRAGRGDRDLGAQTEAGEPGDETLQQPAVPRGRRGDGGESGEHQGEAPCSGGAWARRPAPAWRRAGP